MSKMNERGQIIADEDDFVRALGPLKPREYESGNKTTNDVTKR